MKFLRLVAAVGFVVMSLIKATPSLAPFAPLTPSEKERRHAVREKALAEMKETSDVVASVVVETVACTEVKNMTIVRQSLLRVGKVEKGGIRTGDVLKVQWKIEGEPHPRDSWRAFDPYMWNQDAMFAYGMPGASLDVYLKWDEERNVYSVLGVRMGMIGKWQSMPFEVGEVREQPNILPYATSPIVDPPVDRLIVALRDQKPNAMSNYISHLSKIAGITLTIIRPMSGGAYVLKLPRAMNSAEITEIVKKLRADPNVEYADPDYIFYESFNNSLPTSHEVT